MVDHPPDPNMASGSTSTSVDMAAAVTANQNHHPTQRMSVEAITDYLRMYEDQIRGGGGSDSGSGSGSGGVGDGSTLNNAGARSVGVTGGTAQGHSQLATTRHTNDISRGRVSTSTTSPSVHATGPSRLGLPPSMSSHFPNHPSQSVVSTMQIQQTRSGRIVRPPPPPPPPPPVQQPLQVQPPSNPMNDLGGGTGQLLSGEMIDSIGHVNAAILRNLMGNGVGAGSGKGRDGEGYGNQNGFGAENGYGSDGSKERGIKRKFTDHGSHHHQPHRAHPQDRHTSHEPLNDYSPESDSSPTSYPNDDGLNVADKAAIRKEKNRLAAIESRKRKGMVVDEMRATIVKLENDYGVLESKFKVLEQQHARLQAHYAELRNRHIVEPSPAKQETNSPFPNPLNPPSLSSHQQHNLTQTLVQDGMQMNVEQYLAQSLGPAPPLHQPQDPLETAEQRATREAAQAFDWSPTLAAFLRQDYENEPDAEEEDADFLPSSPQWTGLEVERETPSAGIRDEKDETTPTNAIGLDPGPPTDTTPTGTFGMIVDGNETGASPGDTEEDEDEDSDELEYDEDEWGDDGLFLPIEDVPIPLELQAIQTAPQASHSSSGPLGPQPTGTRKADATSSNETMASALAASGFLTSSDWQGATVGLGGGSLPRVLTTPDRGYGLGRGVQLGQDPTALMRQIYILTQNQQRTTNSS